MNRRPWAEFFAAAPLTPAVRADLTRLYTEKVDYLPALAPEAKVAALQRMSYADFLLKHARLRPESLPWFAGMAFRNNMRVDTCPAYTAARGGRSPGFAGMALPHPIEAEAEHFHFPDGNASIARLLVNRLVPGVFGPAALDQETIVRAPADYAALDRPDNKTRVRLSSTAIRVEHLGAPTVLTEKAVRVVYMRDGKPRSVTGANVILACFNNIIPHIVPELPEEQKAALRYPSKVPMQYTNVLLRDWKAWKALGVRSISAPNGYHTSASLDTAMAIGGYASAMDPSEPVVVHMVRNPNQPGLSRKDQNRAGRADMLATPFETIEREIRAQLQRMLGAGGFDARRDILAITVNRWPHGYAYTYDTLGDPDMPDAQRPHVSAAARWAYRHRQRRCGRGGVHQCRDRRGGARGAGMPRQPGADLGRTRRMVTKADTSALRLRLRNRWMASRVCSPSGSGSVASVPSAQARAASDRGTTVMARPLRAMSRQAAVESSS
jgi:spermidine dehydrogenase